MQAISNFSFWDFFVKEFFFKYNKILLYFLINVKVRILVFLKILEFISCFEEEKQKVETIKSEQIYGTINYFNIRS